MTTVNINGVVRTIDAPPNMPVVWVLRDLLGLTGTKFGCGVAQCGGCTIHVDGKAVRSCVLPLGAVAGKTLTTIEGIGSPAQPHKVQKAWVAVNVPQCGYCQSGQIMSACALLDKKPSPTDDEIDVAMSGNICRCGTYPRIRQAIHDAAGAP